MGGCLVKILADQPTGFRLKTADKIKKEIALIVGNSLTLILSDLKCLDENADATTTDIKGMEIFVMKRLENLVQYCDKRLNIGTLDFKDRL